MRTVRVSCRHCQAIFSPGARFCGVCGALDTTTLATSSAIVELSPGTRLGQDGRYRINRIIGEGGFGRAYLADDQRLNRRCVIKQLLIDATWGAETQQLVRQSFGREATLLVSLNTPGHPNIPEIYAYLAEADCLVMKYIEGQDLAVVLAQRGGTLPVADALAYARDIGSAVAYMHNRTPEPVLHRDIKPANMLCDSRGHVWLIDFGLSKAVPTQMVGSDPRISMAMGTVGYAPPEQWQGAAGPPADVYALATTLHTLLTGYYPAMRGLGALPPVRQFNAIIPVAVETIIRRATEIVPDARPSMPEFVAALEAALQTVRPRPLLQAPDGSTIANERELAAWCMQHWDSALLDWLCKSEPRSSSGVSRFSVVPGLSEDIERVWNEHWLAEKIRRIVTDLFENDQLFYTYADYCAAVQSHSEEIRLQLLSLLDPRQHTSAGLSITAPADSGPDGLASAPAGISFTALAAVPAIDSWPPGMRLDMYRIERLLDVDRVSQIYVADDIALNRRCLIWRCVPDPTASAEQQDEARQRFRRTAALLVALNSPGHPNIPDVYDNLVEHDSLVMKYVGGHSLRVVLTQQGGLLPVAEALACVRDVCSALAYLHNQTPHPVLHGHVVPSNVVCDTHGRVWLTEFSRAEATDDPQADVAAAATLLYTLLTGNEPSQSAGRLPPLRLHNSDVTAEIEELIQRAVGSGSHCLTAQALLAELDTLLNPTHPVLRVPDGSVMADAQLLVIWCVQHWQEVPEQFLIVLPDQLERCWGNSALADEARTALKRARGRNARLHRVLMVLDPHGYTPQLHTPDGGVAHTPQELSSWCEQNWVSAAAWLWHDRTDLPEQIEQCWSNSVLAGEVQAILQRARGRNAQLHQVLMALDPHGYTPRLHTPDGGVAPTPEELSSWCEQNRVSAEAWLWHDRTDLPEQIEQCWDNEPLGRKLGMALNIPEFFDDRTTRLTAVLQFLHLQDDTSGAAIVPLSIHGRLWRYRLWLLVQTTRVLDRIGAIVNHRSAWLPWLIVQMALLAVVVVFLATVFVEPCFAILCIGAISLYLMRRLLNRTG